MSYSKAKLTLIVGPENTQKKTEMIRLLEVNSFRLQTKSLIVTSANDYAAAKQAVDTFGTK